MPISQQVVFPPDAYPAPSYCKYFYLGAQPSGDIANSIAGKAAAVKNAGLTDGEVWANPGYATVGGGAGNYATIDPATHDLSLNGFTVVVAARIKKVAAAFPGAEQYIIASYAPGSQAGGIILSCRTDGAARMYVNTVGDVAASVTTPANTLTNGTTATERTVSFIFPREAGVSSSCGVDGIQVATAPATTVAGASLAGGRAMRFGEPLSGGTIDAYQFGSFQAYMVPRDLSAMSVAAIHNWVWVNPHLPIPDWVFGL